MYTADEQHTAHREDAAEEEDEFMTASSHSAAGHLRGPFVHMPHGGRAMCLLIHRDSAGSADQVGSVGSGGKVEEGLCLLRQGDALLVTKTKGRCTS